MKQIITPTPNIPCKPGWCLAYVNEAFGVPKRYGSATAAWDASPTQHHDRNFPAGVWLPVWFSLENEPAGHVALMAPDGSVYSTSDLSNTPHHHLDLSDLMNYYARYDMTLTYLGWTEDVEGAPVLAPSDGASAAVAAQGTITPTSVEEEEMTPAQMQEIKDWMYVTMGTMLEQYHGVTRGYVVGELGKKIADTGYEIKVFAQASDNFTGDRVINDNRAVDKAKP